MAISDRQMLDPLSQTPFIDSAELAGILGQPHATVHRALTGLLEDGIVRRVSHGSAHLPSSQRYHLTANGISEAAQLLGFDLPSDFVRTYPASREWLTLLIPQDGRGGERLPSLRFDVPRHRRAPVPAWSFTAGAASTPPSPFTTAAASASCARTCFSPRQRCSESGRVISPILVHPPPSAPFKNWCPGRSGTAVLERGCGYSEMNREVWFV